MKEEITQGATPKTDASESQAGSQERPLQAVFMCLSRSLLFWAKPYSL